VLTPPTAEGGSLRAKDLRTSGDPVGLDGTIIRVNPATGAALPTNPLVDDIDGGIRPRRRRPRPDELGQEGRRHRAHLLLPGEELRPGRGALGRPHRDAAAAGVVQPPRRSVQLHVQATTDFLRCPLTTIRRGKIRLVRVYTWLLSSPAAVVSEAQVRSSTSDPKLGNNRSRLRFELG
jgi:hypothetical protein